MRAMNRLWASFFLLLAPATLAGRPPLLRCVGLFCMSAPLAAVAQPAPAWATPEVTQLWKGPRKEAPVEVAWPSGWYISSRPSSGSGAEAGFRTLVSALDLRSGFVASVSVTPARELLQDYYGVDTTMGRGVSSLADLGPPDRLAKLLQRQRDGSLKQAPLTSEVEVMEATNSFDGLSFRSTTVFKPIERVKVERKTPFGEPAPSNPVSDETAAVAATSIVRITQSRTILSGTDADPKLVTLWVSALKESWEDGAEKQTAENILTSFQLQSAK